MSHIKYFRYVVFGLGFIWSFIIQAPAFADTWYELKSDNFIVYSNAREGQIKLLVEDLEYFRFFLQIFTNVKDTKSTLPLEIYAYKSNSKFRKELKVKGGIAGFYLTNFHGTFAYGDASKDSKGEGRQILFHEYVHYFMHQFSAFNYPKWYDEGFADYLSAFSYKGGKVTIGQVLPGRIYSLQNSSWFPLVKILASNDRFEINRKGQNAQATLYAQSWLLVHYLNADPERRKKLIQYLQALHEGVPYDEAFDDIFQMSIKALEKDLKAYWKKGYIPYIMYKFDNVQFKPFITIRKLNDFESELIKIKAKGHRIPYATDLSDFKKEINELIVNYPDPVEAQILLAEKLYFYGTEEEKHEAEEIINKVLQKVSDNSQANALMGIIQFYKLYDTEIQEEKSGFSSLGRDYLKKAVVLDPLNVFAQFYLGFIYVYVGSDKPALGINAMGTALDLLPQSNTFEFHYALINARYGRLDEAAYFFNKNKNWGNYETWNKVADYCLLEIERNAENHGCIFDNLNSFKDD